MLQNLFCSRFCCFKTGQVSTTLLSFRKFVVLTSNVLLFAFVTNQSITVAQTAQDDKQQDETVASEPEAPERVDIKPIARDSEIESRLNEILAATKRFNSPKARVEQGVVFLEGEAKEVEFRQWASDLANKTQDVAATVNRMTVAEKSIWDFSDAYEELKNFRYASVQAIPLVIFALVVLVLTWLLAKLTGFVANLALRKNVPNTLLRWVATRLIMLPVFIFGVYLILRVSGLTQLALTVLGGTGLIGLVIGIAFQDIAENFLASILISVQQPFRVDDVIRVDQHEGLVKRVTTRGTTLMTADGNYVQIPNSKLYKSTIENFTANPLQRIQFQIGIGYDDSTSEAQRIVLERIKAHSATLNDPAPRVLLDALGASTINLIVFVWVDGTKNDVLSVKSSCMRTSKQALMQAGISLPDEAREVIFPKGIPVRMVSENVDQGEGFVGKEDQEAPATAASRSSVEIAKGHVEEDSSEAEGNMASDTKDLQKQAKDSWMPGEGEEILVGDMLE